MQVASIVSTGICTAPFFLLVILVKITASSDFSAENNTTELRVMLFLFVVY